MFMRSSFLSPPNGGCSRSASWFFCFAGNRCRCPARQSSDSFSELCSFFCLKNKDGKRLCAVSRLYFVTNWKDVKKWVRGRRVHEPPRAFILSHILYAIKSVFIFFQKHCIRTFFPLISTAIFKKPSVDVVFVAKDKNYLFLFSESLAPDLRDSRRNPTAKKRALN